MLGGILIDDKGRLWPESSRELVRRIGYRDPSIGIPEYAVRRGLIHIRDSEGGMRVAVCAGRFAAPALAGALRAVHEQAPRRILLAVLAAEDWNYAICASVAELAAHAEDLAADKPFRRRPWLAIEKSPRAMASPTFGRTAPLVRLWRESRGRASAELLASLDNAGLLDRSVLAREIGHGSRLVSEHFGTGFDRAMKPCESLLRVGRDLDDVLDRGYGGWVAESYARTLAERRLRFETCDATFRTGKATSIRARYDRVLMPWTARSGDLLILGISIRRSVTAAA